MSRALTAKSRLETLKKDAKRWLKALRGGDASARARLAAAWPKAPPEPTLRDMQQALALEYGLADWKALLAALADLAIQNQSRDDRIEAVLRHGWDGDVLVARRIVERDPDIARADIFTAATCGEVEEVRRRLAADPKAATAIGGTRKWTALAYCAYGRMDSKNAVDIARLLLDAGADPNFAFDDGWGNPFKLVTGAIGMGEGAKPSHAQADQLVDLFVERGADPYDTQALYNMSIVGDDPHWYETLWRHCERAGRLGSWREVSQGLGGKLKLTSINYLLGNAVGQNQPNHAAWILAHGADPNTPHAYTGQPVLTVARLSGFTEIVALLERHGATTPPLTGVEAFQAACLMGDEKTTRAMAAADPSLLGRPGPLLTAAAHGKAKAVKLLLALGASPRVTDHVGISPLHRAVQNGSSEIVDLLLAAGADPDLRERNWNGTPLSWAHHLGQLHLTGRLAPLSRDARALARLGLVDRLDEVLRAEPALAGKVLEGEKDAPTPLFCLPQDEDQAAAVARVLMACAPDTRVKGMRGWTAEQTARFQGLDEAADVIAGKG